MGDLFVKMVKCNDIAGLGKLSLALAGIHLASNALLAVSEIAIDAMAAKRNQSQSNVRFLSRDEAKAETETNKN